MNPNPSAWFAYVKGGNGPEMAVPKQIAQFTGYTLLDWSEGTTPYNPDSEGFVCFVGAPNQGKHRFRPPPNASVIWVIEHDFFGDAVCANAAEPLNLDDHITRALKACGFNLKGIGIE